MTQVQVMKSIKDNISYCEAPSAPPCMNCDDDLSIQPVFFICRNFTASGKREIRFLCLTCNADSKNHFPTGRQYETMPCYVREKGFFSTVEPSDFEYVDYWTPTPMQQGKIKTVFEAALEHKEGEVIEDNTVYALRESFEGARIGLEPDEVDKLDAPVDDVRAYLLSQQVVEPKKIEQKEDVEL